MAMIFISRDRQSLGQFTEQEVAEGLASGRFLPTDLAWREPMPAWEPLSTFADLPAPGLETPPSFSAPVTSVSPSSTAVEPAWERTESSFSFSALIETVKEVLSKPKTVFAAMPTEGGYGKPLKFFILIAWLTGIVALAYQLAGSLINPEMFLGEEAKEFSPTVIVGIFVGIAIVYPLLMLIGIFISASTMHLALMIVGGAKNSFQATFRAVCYANGTASVVQLVPVLGGFAYMILSAVYTVIALKEAHRTDLWRPIAAMVVLVVLCCGFAFALGLGVAGLAAAAGAAASQQ